MFADFMKPSENYLTGNDVTVYAIASLDLKLDGPTVVDIPAGMMGNANDAFFKYLTDFGPTGPDKGKGGKYLFLPPGTRVTNRRLLRGALSELPDLGHDARIRRRHRRRCGAVVQGPSQGVSAVERTSRPATNVSGMGINSLAPEDGSVYEMLNEIIQYEPTALFDDALLGKLATLGIEKGKAFAPDDRMKLIFDRAAKLGVAMSRAILYANRDPEIRYWPNRHWEKMFIRNTEFMVDGIVDIDAQTLWLYQAICVSPSLLSTTPGVGTSYLTGIRDRANEPAIHPRPSGAGIVSVARCQSPKSESPDRGSCGPRT